MAFPRRRHHGCRMCQREQPSLRRSAALAARSVAAERASALSRRCCRSRRRCVGMAGDALRSRCDAIAPFRRSRARRGRRPRSPLDRGCSAARIAPVPRRRSTHREIRLAVRRRRRRPPFPRHARAAASASAQRPRCLVTLIDQTARTARPSSSLRREMLTDSLTGLPNRAGFSEQLEATIADRRIAAAPCGAGRRSRPVQPGQRVPRRAGRRRIADHRRAPAEGRAARAATCWRGSAATNSASC